MSSSSHLALVRLCESQLWQNTVLGGADPADLQTVINALLTEEGAEWLDALGTDSVKSPQEEICAFVRFAVIFLDPTEELIALNALREKLCVEVLSVGSKDLPALWGRWVQSVKTLHNKRGGKDQWKLVLWSVTAGWHEVLGCEPERRRLL